MANTTFIEAGTAQTQDTSFYAVTGTVASATDQSHTNGRSLKLSAGAGPTLATASKAGVLADAGRRFSFWYRTDTTPGSVSALMSGLTSGGAATVFSIRLTTTDKLQMQPVGPTAVTGNTVLSLNTWYRISCAYTITNSTTFSFQLYLNGVLEASVTSGTLTNTGTNTFRFVLPTTVGANANSWYSDVFVDDGTDLADPGTISVTPKRPNANGTTNQFTTQIGAGGSGYGTGHSPQVNERPASDTNGWSLAIAGVAKTEEYNIESTSTGDVDISTSGLRIVDYAGWVRAKALNAETASLILNNVTSNISLTTTITTFTAFAGSSTYPAGTGTDIGITTATTTTTVSLYECGVMVAYVPPLTASAGLASGTGTAYGETSNEGPNAGVASGTGTAYAPTANESVNAGNATGTGTAYAPTSSPAAQAGNASGTGTAYQPDHFAETINAGNAAGTGAAYQPAASPAVPAGLASGSGAAYGTSVDIDGQPATATGTGTAYTPAGESQVPAGLASGSGAAYGAAASPSSEPGTGSGTGTAYGPGTALVVLAGLANGTGAAYNPFTNSPAGGGVTNNLVTVAWIG